MKWWDCARWARKGVALALAGAAVLAVCPPARLAAQDVEFREFAPFDEPEDLNFSSFPDVDLPPIPDIPDFQPDPDVTLPAYGESPWTGYDQLTVPSVNLDPYSQRPARGYAPLVLTPQGEYPPLQDPVFNEFLPFDAMSP